MQKSIAGLWLDTNSTWQLPLSSKGGHLSLQFSEQIMFWLSGND